MSCLSSNTFYLWFTCCSVARNEIVTYAISCLLAVFLKQKHCCLGCESASMISFVGEVQPIHRQELEQIQSTMKEGDMAYSSWRLLLRFHEIPWCFLTACTQVTVLLRSMYQCEVSLERTGEL